MDDRSSFFNGVRDIFPAQPANISVGILFGASAVNVGFTPTESTVFSLLTVAARAQLVAVELVQTDATLPVIIATAVLINLRYATFGAALAPKVEHLTRRWRALIAYPLIDITYAFADTRFTDSEADPVDRGWYFLGIGLSWVAVYTGATLVGSLLGSAVGEQYQLEFMIPLLFIALLVSQIDSKQGMVAVLAASVVAVVGAGLPFSLGLLAGGVVGAVLGAALDARMGDDR